jgi:hypothetical protein
MPTHTTQTLKNRKHFSIDVTKTQELTNAVKTARASITAPSEVTMVKRPNKWAKRKSEIKSACSAFTDEEIRLHECIAFSS